MAKTFVALFDSDSAAQSAVHDMVAHGFSRDQISLLSHQRDNMEARDANRDALEGSSMAVTGAEMGAMAGGVGGLLLGLAALAIPGVGPALVAGPLAAGLLGAGLGAAAGGLMGALSDLGVPAEEAGYYAEGVRRGGTLVTVEADETLADRAASILSRHHPVNLTERVEQWRQSGWTRFDPDSAPHIPPVHRV